MLTPSPGELTTEIQGHNLTEGMPDEKTLRDLARNNTIAERLQRSTLRKKPPEK